MSWLAWALVIFLTAAVIMLVTAVLTSCQPRIPLERLADPAPLPGELPRAGRLEIDTWLRANAPVPGPPYGPFPVDTGPLLILSEQAAARIALERDIEAMCAEAEAKIPPRWRS